MKNRPKCDLCLTETLADFLNDVSHICGRERRACDECLAKLEEEMREEAFAEEWNVREHLDADSIVWFMR